MALAYNSPSIFSGHQLQQQTAGPVKLEIVKTLPLSFKPQNIADGSEDLRHSLGVHVGATPLEAVGRGGGTNTGAEQVYENPLFQIKVHGMDASTIKVLTIRVSFSKTREISNPRSRTLAMQYGESSGVTYQDFVDAEASASNNWTATFPMFLAIIGPRKESSIDLKQKLSEIGITGVREDVLEANPYLERELDEDAVWLRIETLLPGQIICQPLCTRIITYSFREPWVIVAIPSDGPCWGKNEISVFLKGVGARDTFEVTFFQVIGGRRRIVWKGSKLSRMMVKHFESAVVIRVPSYHDIAIRKSIQVFFQLKRVSDGAVSQAVPYTYRARPPVVKEGLPCKRLRVSPPSPVADLPSQPSNIQQDHGSQITSQPASSQPVHFSGQPPITDQSSPQAQQNSDSTPMSHTISGPPDIFTVYPYLAGSSGDTWDELLRILMPYIVGSDAVEILKSMIRAAPPSVEKETETERGVLVQDVYVNSKQVLGRIFHEPSIALIRDVEGCNPLHVAASCRPDCLKILLENTNFAASINETNSYGETPLCMAVEANSLDSVRLLLKHGADPNIPLGGHGGTVLHLAAEMRHAEIFGFIAVNGGQLDVERYDRRTPLELLYLDPGDFRSEENKYDEEDEEGEDDEK